MKGPLTKPTVKLIGHDGNAFSIMGGVKKALMQAGADKEYVDKYLKGQSQYISVQPYFPNTIMVTVLELFFVPRDRIELPTRGFSVNYPELPSLLK